MKKILLLLLALPVPIFSHSHNQIMQAVIEQSHKFILDHEGNTVLLTPGYGLKKAGYRSFELHDIVAPGFYRIAGPISRKLTIASDNVTLDIGGQVMSGGLVVAANKQNITIQNGTVDIDGSSGDAIKVNSGCSGITLCDVAARNALGSGICFDTVRDSIIKNCDLSSNTTGLALESCANIVVQNCNATTNRVTGFGLLTSTMCSFVGCNALSTGFGNNETSNTVVAGFISNDGYGNSFNECIANSTQALQTTDFDSIVAGFALRGTEGCSQIIECEASNTQTSVAGVTVPYGILLEAQVDVNLTETATPKIPEVPNTIVDNAWSPDMQYLILGDFSGILYLYRFDSQRYIFTQVDMVDDTSSELRTIKFDPSGEYVAAGPVAASSNIRVYKVNRVTEKLELVVTSETVGQINGGLDWNPTGSFIVIGEQTSPTLCKVFKFDRVANSLELVSSASAPGQLLSTKWSPNGRLIAANDISSTITVTIFSFINNTVSFVDSITVTPSPRSLAWSPDGRYLAMATINAARLFVFRVDDDGTMTQVLNQSVGSGSAYYIDWSSDGRYIALGRDSSQPMLVYTFDRLTETATQVAQSEATTTVASSDSLDWSPDGRFLNWVDFTLQVLTFPSNNVIKNNTVYCGYGTVQPRAIGISGSSTCNLIVGNTCYSNPLNPFMVEENYAFVTNVFNPLFGADPGFASSFAGHGPPTLFNLSFNGCDPIAQVPDVQVQWLRALDKSCDIQTKVDHLLTLIP